MSAAAASGGSSYADDIQEFLGSLWVDLRVLVWGPGKTNNQEWFDKRGEVIKALVSASDGRDTVVTSEELFEQMGEPPIETGAAELVHALKADVIIALVMASPSRQGGVYRELQMIAPHPKLRDKTWIFMPEAKHYTTHFQAGMLAWYREEHKIALPWDALKVCERLRDMCIDKVADERRQRMLNTLNAQMHSEGRSFE